MKRAISCLLSSRKTVLLLTVLALSVPLFVSNQASACTSCAQTVRQTEETEWREGTNGTTPVVKERVDTEFTALRVWTISMVWEDNILPALMMMADQLSVVAMQQVQIIGSFLDAKQQMQAQQVLQKMNARAHKDYHPSVGMCQFGTGAKSLAASERNAEFNAVLMSQRSQDRALGNAFSAAATGEDGDKKSRIKQFREKFCDPADNNNGLKYICDHDQNAGEPEGDGGAKDSKRMNKDIDYVRTVDFPWTMNVNFTDNKITDNEEETLALASNLYGHYVFKRVPADKLKPKTDPAAPIPNMQQLYMDIRALLAKQSVAENSFNAITAMKSEGAPGSKEFIRSVLAEVGVNATASGGELSDVDRLLGENPSYYAQMEVLTKKIFQDPDFYTNLYDTPANVDRKGVALQAFGLMQKFDLFKSYLRSEASLAVLLELAVTDLQQEVENELGTITAGGTPARARPPLMSTPEP